MLHTALSCSSINQLMLDFTDPKDLFSYKTVLGSNSPEKAIVGEKRTFSALSPAEINSSIHFAGHQLSRDLRTIIGSTGRPSSRAIQHYDTYLSHLSSKRSSLELINAEILSSEKYFTNARADHRKRTVPTFEECNSSVMGLHWVLFGIIMIPLLNGNLLPLLQVSTLRPAYVVDRTQNPLHGSEPDPSVQQTLIAPADNSSMDLLASVATGIIEVSPNLGSVADVMEELRKKQHQQNCLHHQISELEKRRKRSVVFADELSGVVAYTARIYQAAMEKAHEARAAFDKATEVASEACVEAHRNQGHHFFYLSKQLIRSWRRGIDAATGSNSLSQ